MPLTTVHGRPNRSEMPSTTPFYPVTEAEFSKLKFATISKILGTMPLKETSDDASKDAERRSANISKENSTLSRICRCEIHGSTNYVSELEHRLVADGHELSSESDYEHLACDDRISRSSQFDIGYVEDSSKSKLLWIISPILKKVVQKLLMPHHAIQSNGEVLCILPPYEPFKHKYADVKGSLTQDFPEQGDQAWQSLDYFMKRNASQDVWQEPQEFKRGASVSHEELWTLFRPKDKVVVVDTLGNKEILEFSGMHEVKQIKEDYSLPDLQVVVWGIVRDSNTTKLKRQDYTFLFKAFEGTRRISALPLYPTRYIENEMEEANLFRELTRRGHVWKEMTSSEQGKSYYYEGNAYRYELLPRGNNAQEEPIACRLVIWNDKASSKTLLLERMKLPANNGIMAPLIDEMDEDFESNAFLCPAVVRATDINAQRFYLVGITESLRKVEWNKSLFKSQLILPPVKKNLLLGLVGNRLTESYKGMGDLVDKKGRGLVVVLHGPSGTGKTFAAEALAEYFERPLRALSIGDVIADKMKLEQRLTKVFDECKQWGAILLLDEADVLLEARSLADLPRNAIVSTFLRKLEYYEGIMFLTTNRIKTIDEAFMSRIQIAIHMDSLQAPERRMLWQKFLGAPTSETSDKEAEEKANEKLFLTHDSRRNLLKHIDEWAAMELNGREIRNTLNIAQSLAYTNNGADGLMSPEDVRDAAREASDFRAHLDAAREA